MEIVLLAVLGIIVWYAGGSVNAMLQGAGQMAAKEFEVYEVDQDIRLAKTRKTQQVKVTKLVEEGPIMSTAELKALLNSAQGVSNAK